MRRASRGSRPVVLVPLGAVSVVVPVDSVSVVVAVEVVSCKHILSEKRMQVNTDRSTDPLICICMPFFGASPVFTYSFIKKSKCKRSTIKLTAHCTECPRHKATLPELVGNNRVYGR